MRRLCRSVYVASCLLVFLCFFGSGALADTSPNSPTTAADVRRELNETLRLIASYSAEQREAAVAKAKESLAKTDAQIEQLQRDFDENRKSMSAEARKQAETTLKVLRQQRNEIAEWYDGLKHSSASAWDEIKKGFSASYRDLEKALEKAREEF